MKYAVLFALSTDRSRGRLLSGVLTADQAISQVKQAIKTGKAPDARYPNVQAVALTDVLRHHRFQVTAAEIAQASKPVEIASGNVHLGDLIPVEIGEGGQMVIINVTTQEEADFLKQLADGALHNCEEIQRIQKAMGDELSAHQTSMAAAEKELADCRDAFVKHEGKIAAANGQIELQQRALDERDERIRTADGAIDLLKADIGARDGTIETITKEVREQCLRIKELEGQLVEAAAKAKKK